MIHWRREWKTTAVFLPREPHEQYEKAKRYDTESELHRTEGAQYATGEEQRTITPERMKQLGQSRNDSQLWMCLVIKVKSDAVKNSTA